MGMSGRLAEYADGMTSVDMNLSDDGSTLTIVLRNLNSDTGGDDDNVINTGNPSVMKAADPTLGITSTDIYFTISEVGTTVNELAENYASSYVPSIAYDSYLTDTLVGTLRHNIKATSNISYHLGDKTTNGVVTTVITSSAYSSRLSISDVEFGFLSLTCGADSYAYLNQIGFDNKITSSQTTNPYDGYYSPSFLTIFLASTLELMIKVPPISFLILMITLLSSWLLSPGIQLTVLIPLPLMSLIMKSLL